MAQYGIFLFKTERYKEAEKYLVRLDDYYKTPTSLLGKAKTILGFLYQFQSKLLIAKNTFQQAEKIWKVNGWVNHPDYAFFLNDYAVFKLNKDSLLLVEQLLQQSEKINSGACKIPSIQGYNASLRGDLLLNLSPNQALQNYLDAVNIFEMIHQSREVAIALTKVGIAYDYLDSLEQAKLYFEKALDYTNRFFRKENSLVRANALQRLANYYVYNRQETKADSIYEIITPIIKQKLGEKTVAYGNVLSNWAIAKEALKKIDVAIKLYHQIEDLDTIILSPFHSNHLFTLYNLARCYSKVDSMHQTQFYYQKANALQLQLLDHYFGNFSESTRLDYRYAAMGNFDKFFSFACFAEQPQLNAEIQNVILATKNRALDFSIRTHSSTKDTDSQEVFNLHQRWKNQKKKLTEVYLMSAEDRKDSNLSIDSLQIEVNQIEKKLIRRINNDIKTNQQVRTSNLKANLQPNEAAIDFFNYHVTDDYGQFPDSIFYFALITRPQWEHPKLVQLLEDDELKEILELTTHYTLNVEVNQYLYQKIWAPLESYLEDVDIIHLSPDGLLHQVSIASLLTDLDTKALLSDKYQLYYYSNLRDFVLGNSPKIISAATALLIGNVDYGALPINEKQETAHKIAYFTNLPETVTELNGIREKLLGKKHQVVNIGAEKATETTFLKEITSLKPKIIHLASHGFFFKKDTSIKVVHTLHEKLKSSKNPMLRSGIVFAGVNQYWSQKPNENVTSDGVLTAMEVASLNLSETQLVVLSACDTGRGFRTDGEGVFGLQRAFKAAGVPYLLMSLWKVPDKPTAELMDYFYTYLLDNHSPQSALTKAQQQVRKKYPNPYDWAGFVIFG